MSKQKFSLPQFGEIYPSKNEYNNICQTYETIPIYSVIPADFETPLSLFVKVKGNCLLESVEKGAYVGQYSFITKGKQKEYIINVKENNLKIISYYKNKLVDSEVIQGKQPFDLLKSYFHPKTTPPYTEKLPLFFGGLVGYIGYESVSCFEKIKIVDRDRLFPESVLFIPEIVIALDSIYNLIYFIYCTKEREIQEEYNFATTLIKETIQKVINASSLSHKYFSSSLKQNKKTPSISSNMAKKDFQNKVLRIKKYIREGDIIQTVLSQKFHTKTRKTPLQIYRNLRLLNPSPYMFLMKFEKKSLDKKDFFIIGSSPETMINVQNNVITLRPIAGTRHRGKTDLEDISIENELLNDEKEKAEHLMLVDLGRNDLSRVSIPTSVKVTKFMEIEKYSHVMHIVSTINANLKKNINLFEVIQCVFPAGTLSGAPKIRAMEIISEQEPTARGPYGGMIVLYGYNNYLDSAITIRTIILKDEDAYVQSGAGIVADSKPENEFKETINKAKGPLSAIDENCKF